jgi:hypothetical protein
MPETPPQWGFLDQGKSLRVCGLVLTHIYAHFAPMHADIEEAPLHALRRLLFWIRTWVPIFSAMANLYFQKTPDGPIEMAGFHGTRLTTEAAHQQTEHSMLISMLYDAFSRMNATEQLRTQNQLTNLMIVATGETFLDVDLNLWWLILRASTGVLGRDWLDNIMSTNTDLRKDSTVVMDILRIKGLSAVCCGANESLAIPGGLAFAGAAARTGDAVALVSGVSFPLVLRPCPDGQGRFRLVGPLVLPGVMDGELKDKVRKTPLGEIILV